MIFDTDRNVTTIRYTIKNYGLTPALHVKHKTIIAVVHDPKTISISDAEIDSVNTESIIFPQAQILSSKLTSDIDRSRLVEAAQENAGERLYVIGVVRYKDVFGYVHHLRFCSVWGGSSMNAFPNCPDGNDTD